VRDAVRPHLSRTEALHLAAALFACVLLPAYSYARGGGGLAWTMFSKSDSFRVSVRATDRAGRDHLLHPLELGDGADPALRNYLRGAGEFRTWPVGPTFLARLPTLAERGCASGAYASVEVTLEQRASLDAPVQVTRARVVCR
jgi:hypothetical protein